jgi:hypothetical protein
MDKFSGKSKRDLRASLLRLDFNHNSADLYSKEDCSHKLTGKASECLNGPPANVANGALQWQILADCFRSLLKTLAGWMFFSALVFPHVVGGQTSCSPTLLSPNEARTLLKAISEAVSAKRIGGKLQIVDWSPGSSYRTESFYFYELLSTKSTETTPLENGVLGYFGVNKTTGQVVELNSDNPSVEGTELKGLQVRFRKEHCIGKELVAENANLTLGK